MPGQIDIDEEIACEILAAELKKDPKNLKDAYALEDYCKKNIDKGAKESMKFSFWNMFNIFKKSKAVAIIHPLNPDTIVTPLHFSDVSQPQPSASSNTIQTPLLVNIESSSV